VSPTLTPIIAQPLAPSDRIEAASEELAFFERVKKYIGNKQTTNEFLKLCNLFSQDLIDRNMLVHRVSNFIGGNPDLMNWFKAFVQYDGHDEVIENRPQAPNGRVALSNCRSLGPSYRLLPKRVSYIHFFSEVLLLHRILASAYRLACCGSHPLLKIIALSTFKHTITHFHFKPIALRILAICQGLVSQDGAK
jgi:hypothetical protein